MCLRAANVVVERARGDAILLLLEDNGSGKCHGIWLVCNQIKEERDNTTMSYRQ